MRSFWRRVLIFLVLCGIPAGVACGALVWGYPTAPDFTLRDLEGNPVSIGQYAGRVVLVDFWATWCGPCRRSIPELIQLRNKYDDQTLAILGLSMDDPRRIPDQKLSIFVTMARINYPVARVNRQIVADFFAGQPVQLPTLFVIDRKGRIRDKIVGYLPGALEKTLQGLLE